jgi:hypothetical protein
MKKVKQLIVALIMLNSSFLLAQNFPQGINYQAVARDGNGNARVNQQIPVQFTIYQSSPTGTVVWQERQLKTTNSMGQFNAVIGTGAPVSPSTPASFAQINWGADSTFLKVEINANISFTGVFSQIGSTTKFQSVPYALYSLNTNSKAPTVRRLLTNGTYTPPAGVLYIEVEMLGGGGGGGGSAGYSGGGGGAGGYLKFIIENPATYTYTIGTGGTGATGGTHTNGVNGGNTTFDSNIAGGGVGGGSYISGIGGPGGTNTFVTGSLLVNMQGNGGGGTLGSGAATIGVAGGAGFYGGLPNTSAGTGATGYNAPANSGSGAAGGSGGGSGGGGGNGGSGIIIIKEYYR